MAIPVVDDMVEVVGSVVVAVVVDAVVVDAVAVVVDAVVVKRLGVSGAPFNIAVMDFASTRLWPRASEVESSNLTTATMDAGQSPTPERALAATPLATKD
jgi:hypothetical protein